MKTYNILKSISVKLDDTYLMILSYMYHSNKQLKESEYRFEIVIDTIDNFKSKISYYNSNVIDEWIWFNSNLKVSYGNLSTNRVAGRWLTNRLKKALQWDDFQKEISVEWRNNGWVSTGFFNSSISNLDLKNVTIDMLINMNEKELHFVSNKAISVKPKYI
jgi:hypothetical protein